MHYLRCDSRAGEVSFNQEKATSLALQAKLDSINCEHGNAYIEGIQPRFDILKARHFDSSWNWVHQDALLTMISFLVSLPPVNRVEKSPCVALPSLTGPTLTCFNSDNSCSTIQSVDASKGETYRLAKEFGQKLIDNTREVNRKPPIYIDGVH